METTIQPLNTSATASAKTAGLKIAGKVYKNLKALTKGKFFLVYLNLIELLYILYK